MARSLRMVRAGVWYHITARGIERRPIFKDDRDRDHFLELLEGLSETFRVRLYAYVLMDNHYHLLLELREPNLSQAMRWLNISYSVWFNRRHRRAGYLFQGRFKSILVDPDTRGHSLSAYIHLNPVRTARHGLSKTDRQHDRAGAGAAPTAQAVQTRLTQLRNFRWSSYRAYAGLTSAPKWLEVDTVLDKGGGARSKRHSAYRKYVEDQVKQGRMDTPWEELQDRNILGATEFISALKKQGTGRRKRGETAAWQRGRASLESIIQAIENAKGETWDEFRNRYGDGGLALGLTMARQYTGLTLGEIGRKLDLAPTMNKSITIRRYRQRLGKDRSERQLAAKVEKMINETI